MWRTLKPFQPSLMRPSGSTSASAAPSPPAASAPPPTITAGRSALANASVDRLGQLAEQLEIVAEPLDLHAEIDLGPDREDLAALARDLADAGGDQRRFPADVGADEQDRVRALDAGDGRVEVDRGEAGRVVGEAGLAALEQGRAQRLRAASSPHTSSRRRPGRRRPPRPSRRPSSAARRRSASASFQLASRSLPFSRSQGRSSRLRTSPSTWWRVLSLVHSSFTSSLMRGSMRITWRWRTSRRMLVPTASMTSIAGHLRELPRPRLEDVRLWSSAPTGQRSTTLPESSLATACSR